jgi:hypothetical protein
MKLIAIVLILIISISCSTSKKAECDAYSKIEKTKNPS